MKEEVKPGQSFEFRPGISSPTGVFAGWGGMMPDLDPGSLPPNRPALVLNCRFEAGQIKPKLGLELLASTPPPWEVGIGGYPDQFVEGITWLGMHHMQARAPLLWLLTTSAGAATIAAYNPDENAVSSIATLQTAVAASFGLGSFGGEVYASAENSLWRLNRRGGFGLVTGAASSVYNLQEFAGKLWCGTGQTWDGVSLAPLTGSFSITSSCVWRDSYLVGVGYGDPNYTYGDYTGLLTNVALPGTVTNPYKNAVVEFREAVYVASGGRDIYKIIPGVSSAVVHTLPVDSTVVALATLGDYLFYLYTTTDGGNSDNYLGIYDPDGTTIQWVDQHKVLLELAGGDARSMVTYRNRLYVGTTSVLGTHTLSCDATSDWYVISGGSANTGLLVA